MALAACSATPIHLPFDELGLSADSGASDSFRGPDGLSGGMDSDLEGDKLHVDGEAGPAPPEADATPDAVDGAGEGTLDGAGEAGQDGGVDAAEDATADDAPAEGPSAPDGSPDLTAGDLTEI